MPPRLPIAAKYLFLQTLLMNTGFFMLIPMLSIHYLSLGLTAVFIGNLYAVRILSQQGLQLIGGSLADRVPYRYVILAGCLIRAVGFALFALITTGPWLYLAATLFGLGGAFFGPASTASLAAVVPAASKARAFTISQAMGNIGTTIGPMIGALLVFNHFTLICMIAGGLFTVLGIAGVWLLPDVRLSDAPVTMRSGLRSIADNRVFLRSVALFMGYFVIYQQMYIAVPDLLAALHAPKAALGELFSFEAVLEIAISYPAIVFLQRNAKRWSSPRFMALGLFVMGLSWVPLIFHVNIPLILIPVVGLSIGSVVAMPSRQTYTADLAEPQYLATYFGVSSFSMAIGASVGASGGGYLMHMWAHPAGWIASVPSLLFAIIALLCAYFMNRLPAARTAPVTHPATQIQEAT